MYKYKYLIFIYLIFSIFIVKAQNFTETCFKLDSNRLGLGIENNNYIFVTYKITNFFILNAVNSVFTEKIQYQRYIINSYFKLYKYKALDVNCAIKAFGNYKSGIIDKSFSPQFNIITNKVSFSTEFNSIINKSLKVYPKVSLGIHLKDKIIFAEYGTPFYGYDNETITNLGILFNEKKIVLKTLFQIPTLNDYKHTRLVLSFIYRIN